jgi:hypothetical protein
VRLGISLLLCTFLIATSAFGANAIDSLLSTNPTTEAERAFASGDRRYIVVPMCRGQQGGEVIPGWPQLEDSPEVQAAIENGRRPITCKDLVNDSESRDFQRVAKYAKQYNIKIYELVKRVKNENNS